MSNESNDMLFTKFDKIVTKLERIEDDRIGLASSQCCYTSLVVRSALHKRVVVRTSAFADELTTAFEGFDLGVCSSLDSSFVRLAQRLDAFKLGWSCFLVPHVDLGFDLLHEFFRGHPTVH